MKNAIGRWLLLLSLGLGVITRSGGSAAASEHPGGRLSAAAQHWRLPDAPNGLKPSQSWAMAGAPDGDIYVAGMDHATDAALYGLDPRTGALRFLGDARSASEAARNWRPGETAQKFHTRPLWLGGKIYVATLDRSELDDGYLRRRGFHWYAYDPARDRFADLSASEPGGSAAAHGGLVALAGDPARNVIYGAGAPTAEIFRYDVAKGRTTDLGRPPAYDRPYPYTGRVMWLDSRGRLYFTAGNARYHRADPAIYGHVYFYDPARGFGERKDWRLAEPRALDAGGCARDGSACFFADDAGHFYRFSDDGPRWSYVGQAAIAEGEPWIWVTEVSPDGRKAYLVTTSPVEDPLPSSLYEFDLASGRTRRLCALADLGGAIGRLTVHTGAQAWDRDGRFYFASFTPGSGGNAVVTRVDPVRLKAALGLLPAIGSVSVTRTAGAGAPRFVFSRSGDAGSAQEVLYEITAEKRRRYGSLVIPAGKRSAAVALETLAMPPGAARHGRVSVVANGDDYVAGARRSLSF